MKNRSYSDWFGCGDTNNDVSNAILEYGKPLKIFFEPDGFAASLVYEDKVVTVGYDNNEYCVHFVCNEIE